MKQLYTIAFTLLSVSAFAQCFEKIDAGDWHSLAITSNGKLWGWGSNQQQQLGNGASGNIVSATAIGDDNWSDISAGQWHSAGIKSNGTLWAWGLNENGQLGDGTTTMRPSPVQIGTDDDWQSVNAGYFFTMAIKTNGTLWAWGNNGNGEFGTGNYSGSLTPIQVGTATDWTKITGFHHHSLALKSDGTLWGCGWNQNGEVGIGSNAITPTWTQIAPGTTWIDVVATYSHSAAVKSDGTLWAWGWNFNYQLGDGTQTNRNLPVQIGTASDWAKVDGTQANTYAIKQNGSLYAWGINGQGECGQTSAETYIHTPSQIGGDLEWAQISGGTNHGLGLKSNGNLFAWGYNYHGELASGNTSNYFAPNPVSCPALSMETATSANVVLYPNPGRNSVFIKSHERAPFQIFDLTGKSVKSGNLEIGENELDTTDLASGSYFLKVASGNTQTLKLVKS